MSQKEEEGKSKIIPYSLSDIISLEVPFIVKISPNGNKVAFTVNITNWKENRYELVCFVYDTNVDKKFQLTNTGTVSDIRWLDENSLLLIKKEFNGDDKKAQIYLYQNLIGDGLKLTSEKKGVHQFEIFNKGIIYLTTNEEKKDRKDRKDFFGSITHVEEDRSLHSLKYFDLSLMVEYNKKKGIREEKEFKKIPEPILNISSIFLEPYSILNIKTASDNKNRFFVNSQEKDDLVFIPDTKSFCIEGNITECLNKVIQHHQSKLNSEERKNESKNGEKNDDNENEELKQIILEYLYISEVFLPKAASIMSISPNAKEIIYNYSDEHDFTFYIQQDLWKVNYNEIKDKKSINDVIALSQILTKELDQDIMMVKWNEGGIFVYYFEGCYSNVSIIDSESSQIRHLFSKNYIIYLGIDIDNSGRNIVTIGGTSSSLVNVNLLSLSDTGKSFTNISNLNKEFDTSVLGTTEVISWESKDGTRIEGVLRKPNNFNPNKKYPLLFEVHGGPTWLDVALPVVGYDRIYYPTMHFLQNDILVLKPNYRGSIGRGASFKQLNVENLGVGDLWDLESAIDYLYGLGYVDKDNIGVCGWSQGGYISAYASINSSKFKAVSVGAGITNWYTYHINTDIRIWTEYYHKGNPYEKEEAYKNSAPITNIGKNRTPTLIQHGTNDARVPFSNASELFRALKDHNVPVEFFSFPGMPHGITKPKENRAVVTQNFTWFLHHLLGKELDFNFKEET